MTNTPLKSIVRHTAAAAAICGGILASANAMAWVKSEVVKVDSGWIDGNKETVIRMNGWPKQVYSWLGVPYADPPGRWEAPQAPSSWSGVLKTEAFKEQCIQINPVFEPGSEFTGSEDCLYANVWRPNTTVSNLPVFVYIHGGANTTGRGPDLAKMAAQHNVVIMSFNYRLGLFGQLMDPNLASTTDPLQASGNFALLDAIRMLEWANENATAFGGNPNNVTVGGFSAGGHMTWQLLASPQVQGKNLVDRAISISALISGEAVAHVDAEGTLGPSGHTIARRLLIQALYDERPEANDEAAWQAAVAEADAAIAGGTSDELLRAIPADKLVCLSNRARAHGESQPKCSLRSIPSANDPNRNSNFSYLYALGIPFSDGFVFPEVSLKSALEAGNYEHVPMIVGQARRENKFFAVVGSIALWDDWATLFGYLEDEQFNDIFDNYDPNAPSAVLASLGRAPVYNDFVGNGRHFYTNNQGNPALGFAESCNFKDNPAKREQFFSDSATDHVGNAISYLLASGTAPNVWAYEFDWSNQPAPFDQIFGATHASDLPFWFHDFEVTSRNEVAHARLGFTNANQQGRIGLSNVMGLYFGNFVWNGNPNYGNLVPATWWMWQNSNGIDTRMHFDADSNWASVQMGPTDTHLDPPRDHCRE